MHLKENLKRFDRIGKIVFNLHRKGKPIPPQLLARLDTIGRGLNDSMLRRGAGIIAGERAASVLPPERQAAEYERVRNEVSRENFGVQGRDAIKDLRNSDVEGRDAIRAFNRHARAAEIINKSKSIERYKKSILDIVSRNFNELRGGRRLSPRRRRSVESIKNKLFRILGKNVPPKERGGDLPPPSMT